VLFTIFIIIVHVTSPSFWFADCETSFDSIKLLLRYGILRLMESFCESFVGTYMGRSRRHASNYFTEEVSEQAINTAIAERQILRELGPKACILEEPCKIHAHRKAPRGAQPDWNDVLR